MRYISLTSLALQWTAVVRSLLLPLMIYCAISARAFAVFSSLTISNHRISMDLIRRWSCVKNNMPVERVTDVCFRWGIREWPSLDGCCGKLWLLKWLLRSSLGPIMSNLQSEDLGPLWATNGHYHPLPIFDLLGCICSTSVASFEASLCLIVINEIPTLSSEQRKTCGRISVPQMREVQLH